VCYCYSDFPFNTRNYIIGNVCTCARARVQLVGIILSIVLCLAVREQQQQQQDAEDEVDSAAEKKGGHRRLSDEEPAA